MKRFLKLLPCIAIAVLLACIALQPTKAHAATVEDLTFTLNSDGASYSVTDCNGSTSGELVIPATYNGLPVTAIGESAFFDRGLRSVDIPNSVTRIGDYAFYSCNGLNSVSIPTSVTRIGNYAFFGCTSLTNVTLPESITSIGTQAFAVCFGLTSITIPDSVTSIGSHAFYDCNSLTNVIIGNGITYFGANGFYGCEALTSVTIGNSLTGITGNMFYGCTSLNNVTIPDSVTGIGNYAFNGCISLTNVTIPDSVTAIDSYAFRYCDNLTDVFYTGTQAQWNAIKILPSNDCLLNATLHFVQCETNGHTLIEDLICDICGCTAKLTADDITLGAVNKLTVTNENTICNNLRATVYFLGEKTVEDITDEDALKAIDGDAKTHWGLTSINKVQLLKSGNYVIQLHYNVGTGAKQTVAKAFTVSIAKPVVEMNEHKVVVTAGDDICTNYRATVYALGNETVENIYDEAALNAIDATAKTQWGLAAINKLQLPENGNYVIHLHYNVGAGAKQTVAKAFTVSIAKPVIEMNEHKVVVTAGDDICANYRATVYALGNETVENIYDEAALKAIDATAKTQWGLAAINKLQLPQNGNYVIHLHYNVGAGAKQTVAKAVTVDNGEPTLQVENGKLIATDPENAYIYHRAVVYYLGEETSIDNAITTKTCWGLGSINKAQLTQPGNYVILLHYNLEGSIKLTTTLEVTI